ncbi:RNA polymerase sigma factor [Stigmatella aurantiaca]|uniref:RNA polymerase sigma-70 factor, ECF subfamily n=2 Tax=Stigmatella aurantiaca (strain DW4/3-1) TaxID=378806 RepID=E3FPL8_STIAD|nr:RNA polymerase sigma factor [Stigmatella aurantiaca]ADO73213.1 RNA polymerase sigma-70 factor, ECF subfamily [Stigmatella aurantiaca DW4/3-1]
MACEGVLGPETSDEGLMLAFQAGDARAFEALVRRHRMPVFNFILRFTGHPARAEDVLQETWLKVVRSARDYKPRAKFTTWLYTIARNLCVDSARKESYRQASSLEAPSGVGAGAEEGRSLGETLPDTGEGPERGAYNARVRPLLTRALASLPEEQREVFVLREYSGIAFKDIAEVTGVSENTVKSRMRYALEGLRRRLTELGVDGDLADDGKTVAG